MSHYTCGEFLTARQSDELLAYAIRNERNFTTTTIGRKDKADFSFRRSRRLPDLGAFHEVVAHRAGQLLGQLISELKVTPFSATDLEIELVAHEDGAFYKRHIDLYTGSGERQKESGDRLISLVAYFHSRPKSFSGGELALYPDPRPGRQELADAVVIEPAHATFAAFSSWMPHEVRPVSCPGGRFEDSRFAINCWYLRRNK